MTINIGIIGYGVGGRSNHLGATLAGARVSAICDPAISTNESNYYPDISFYSKPNDFFHHPNLDLIVIATPDNQHLALTESALKTGKYVFIEKPLATNLKDLCSYESLTHKYKNQLIYSEKYSFSPIIQQLLKHSHCIGSYTAGFTAYTMNNCDRIMGNGKWRTESSYNPCAGGLSHNFITALLFIKSPITRVQAVGEVVTYHKNLDKFSGYDSMSGILQFQNGKYLSWSVNLSNRFNNSWGGHRTVFHILQFQNGSLAYGPKPSADQIIVNGVPIDVDREPEENKWPAFNTQLYKLMYENLLGYLSGEPILHSINQGINVSKACVLAFESAKNNGQWLTVD